MHATSGMRKSLAALLRRDAYKLKNPVAPCSSAPNPLIYKERAPRFSPKMPRFASDLPQSPFSSPSLLLSFFPLKIKEKEKESSEKTRKGRATVSRCCLFFEPRNWRRATPHFVAFRGRQIHCSVRLCGLGEGVATESWGFFACVPSERAGRAVLGC